jgi:chromosome segregation ATPase
LEKELDRLKHATDDDEYLREKMEGIQEGFEKQVKKIQSLEDDIETKNREIEALRNELYKKLRRIVELEFDLETHDIHYTTYAAEQFKLGEEALEEIKATNPEASVFEMDGNGTGEKRKVTPRRAQRLISKLLSDLDSLESRYKNDKLESSKKIEKFQIDNNDLRTKLRVLEKRVETTTIPEDAEDVPDDLSDDFSTIDKHDEIKLRKRIEVLEAKRFLYRKEMDKLKEEIESTKKAKDAEIKRIQLDMDKMTLDNGSLRLKLDEILSDSAEKSVFTQLEMRVNAGHKQVKQLEGALELKEKQIDTLKKEIATMRLKGLAVGETKGSLTKQDSELVRQQMQKASSMSDDGDMSLADAASASLLRDQELVIERAKSASTAAGLLARITELSKLAQPPPFSSSESPRTPRSSTGKKRLRRGYRISM